MLPLNCMLHVFFSSTDACENIKNTLPSQALQSDRQFDDVCQAKLTSISLYVLYCKNIEYGEVSLNFTFQLPTCGKFSSVSNSACTTVVHFVMFMALPFSN